MGTVAPIRKLDKNANANWYAKLVDWWGFDPMDIAPVMGGVAKLGKKAGKKASTTVGKKELDQLWSAFKNPPWKPVEEIPVPAKRAANSMADRKKKNLKRAKETGVIDKALKTRGYYEP